MVKFEAVIFDFGGVFTTSPVANFALYERDHGLPEKFIGGVIKTNMHDNAWARLERGEIGPEEFDVAFAAETRAAGHEIRGATLISLLSLTLNENMIDALMRVRARGLKTGCITNNMPKIDALAMLSPAEREAKADRVRAVFDMFDHVIESSKAGVRKPEPRIYEMMCDALGVAPAQCLFIDDLGVNLKPARAMGMTTIKAPIGDVSPAIAELDRLLGALA